MMKVCILFLIVVVQSQSGTLLLSSADTQDILLNGRTPTIYGVNMFSNLPYGGGTAICRTTASQPGGLVFTVVHSFSLECYKPLRLHLVPDNSFIAYLNGQRVCSGGAYQQISVCDISKQILGECGKKTLEIQIYNVGGDSSLIYQLEQTEDVDCEIKCPKPLVWVGLPICSCQCDYTSACGPGFKWNGKTSTYAYTKYQQKK